MYAFFEKPQDKALLIFRFENPGEAVRILQENRIEVSGKEKLGLG
jgi:hypothetical protein